MDEYIHAANDFVHIYSVTKSCKSRKIRGVTKNFGIFNSIIVCYDQSILQCCINKVFHRDYATAVWDRKRCNTSISIMVFYVQARCPSLCLRLCSTRRCWLYCLLGETSEESWEDHIQVSCWSSETHWKWQDSNTRLRKSSPWVFEVQPTRWAPSHFWPWQLDVPCLVVSSQFTTSSYVQTRDKLLQGEGHWEPIVHKMDRTGQHKWFQSVGFNSFDTQSSHSGLYVCSILLWSFFDHPRRRGCCEECRETDQTDKTRHIRSHSPCSSGTSHVQATTHLVTKADEMDAATTDFIKFPSPKGKYVKAIMFRDHKC